MSPSVGFAVFLFLFFVFVVAGTWLGSHADWLGRGDPEFDLFGTTAGKWALVVAVVAGTLFSRLLILSRIT